MNSRSIGKLVTISNRWIVAEMYENMGNYISTSDGVRFVGEIGSYVSVEDIGRKIIAEVVGVDEKSYNASESYSKPMSSKYIHLNLIGEIVEKNFYFGVSKMPLIYSEIQIINESDLRIMLEVEQEEEIIENSGGMTRGISLNIGQSIIFPDYSVRLNIDKFFGFHFAIFGNTGAGKSNSMARIIQNVFMKENYSARGAKFVIVDSNGEYKTEFDKIHESNPNINSKTLYADPSDVVNEKLEIPVWALSVDDWAILLHASEKTQIPILKRAIDIAKIFFNPNNKNLKVKNHILASTLIGIVNSSDTSPSKSDKLKAIMTTFNTKEISLDITVESGRSIRDCISIYYGNFTAQEDFQNYCSQFIVNDLNDEFSSTITVTYDINQFCEAVNFAVLYEGSISSQRIQEYTSTLVTRLQALKDSDQGRILTKTSFDETDKYIENLIGDNQILNLDVSSLDDSSCEVVAKVITKVIFDYLKKKPQKAQIPINLIIEEAHRFVKNENAYGPLGYNIFERVAKEGRKFGLLLGISSQRPSELSKTVISQCSNFIIHRVQNPDDLLYISRMVPYISQGIIERLTVSGK